MATPQISKSISSNISRGAKFSFSAFKKILPDFDKNNYFEFSFDIPNTDYCLAFNEEENSNDFRISKIEILGEGINLGSGGGPTLTNLCEVGKLTYKGKVKFNHFNSF